MRENMSDTPTKMNERLNTLQELFGLCNWGVKCRDIRRCGVCTYWSGANCTRIEICALVAKIKKLEKGHKKRYETLLPRKTHHVRIFIGRNIVWSSGLYANNYGRNNNYHPRLNSVS